jgi:hypothetical protein
LVDVAVYNVGNLPKRLYIGIRTQVPRYDSHIWGRTEDTNDAKTPKATTQKPRRERRKNPEGNDAKTRWNGMDDGRVINVCAADDVTKIVNEVVVLINNV